MPRRTGKGKGDAASDRSRTSGRPRLPVPPELKAQIDQQVRLLRVAVSNPSTWLAGLEAVRAFQRAVELTTRSGPRDPRVLEALRAAETASITAAREVLSSMLAELDRNPSTASSPEVKGEEELVQVPVEREENGTSPSGPSKKRSRKG